MGIKMVINSRCRLNSVSTNRNPSLTRLVKALSVLPVAQRESLPPQYVVLLIQESSASLRYRSCWHGYLNTEAVRHEREISNAGM